MKLELFCLCGHGEVIPDQPGAPENPAAKERLLSILKIHLQDTVKARRLLPDGRYAVVFVIVTSPADVRPGARAIDLLNVASIMTFYDPVSDTAAGGGLLLPGTLTLTQAATTAGAPVVGSVTGTVIEL